MIGNNDTLSVLLAAQGGLDYWKKRNGTQTTDSVKIPDSCEGDNSTAVKYSYSGTKDIVFYKVINGGHAVPVKGPKPLTKGLNCDFDSITEAWNFLLSYKKE